MVALMTSTQCNLVPVVLPTAFIFLSKISPIILPILLAVSIGPILFIVVHYAFLPWIRGRRYKLSRSSLRKYRQKAQSLIENQDWIELISFIVTIEVASTEHLRSVLRTLSELCQQPRNAADASPAQSLIEKLMYSKDDYQRMLAARELGHVGYIEAVPYLILKKYTDEVHSVRFYAAVSLDKIRHGDTLLERQKWLFGERSFSFYKKNTKEVSDEEIKRAIIAKIGSRKGLVLLGRNIVSVEPINCRIDSDKSPKLTKPVDWCIDSHKPLKFIKPVPALGRRDFMKLYMDVYYRITITRKYKYFRDQSVVTQCNLLPAFAIGSPIALIGLARENPQFLPIILIAELILLGNFLYKLISSVWKY